MAEGRVCVWPGMFDTKVMVAPNSPIALAKARTAPAITPGRIRGRVTVAQTHGPEAPSVPAACSSRGSTASTDSRIARTISGKAMMAAASTAPVQRKANTMPNHWSSHWPTQPRRPKVSSSR